MSIIFGLALGLLPLVDNYAHIFGLLCGFWMGAGLLAPKCFECGYEERKRKLYTWYTECLALVCGVLVVVWLGVAFFFVYSNKDALEWCGWCKYLSCLDVGAWQMRAAENVSNMI